MKRLHIFRLIISLICALQLQCADAPVETHRERIDPLDTGLRLVTFSGDTTLSLVIFDHCQRMMSIHSLNPQLNTQSPIGMKKFSELTINEDVQNLNRLFTQKKIYVFIRKAAKVIPDQLCCATFENSTEVYKGTGRFYSDLFWLWPWEEKSDSVYVPKPMGDYMDIKIMGTVTDLATGKEIFYEASSQMVINQKDNKEECLTAQISSPYLGCENSEGIYKY